MINHYHSRFAGHRFPDLKTREILMLEHDRPDSSFAQGLAATAPPGPPPTFRTSHFISRFESNTATCLPMKLSPDFAEALVYATAVHGGQLRKKTQIPYIGHLLGVAAIALEYGAEETEAIGALLHDAVEDGGGPERQREIEKRFGKKVGAIVAGCTDSDETPKPPWRERKEKYIAHLADASASIRLVSAADKLHNARAIVHNLRDDGATVWERFKAGKEGALWYYRALVNAFQAHGKSALVAELDRVVTEMEKLAQAEVAYDRGKMSD